MNQRTVVFALDIGFGNVKAYGPARDDPNREMQFHFPAVVVRAASVASEGTGALARFNVHRVIVGGEEYFVGVDAHLLVNQRTSGDLCRDYPKLPQYYALALGAFERAGYRHIDVLALGLPAQYSNDVDLIEAMRARFIGEHVTASLRVQVDDVMVFSQPVGGVASFAYEKHHMDTMRDNRCLVIDPGYNTLGWTEVDHFTILRRPLDSVHGGTIHYLAELYARIRTQYPDYQPGAMTELDAAVRGEGNVKYAGRAIDISQHAGAALGVFDGPISTMISVTGPLTAFGSIFVVGGAAPIFVQALQRRYPELTLTLPDLPPIMANARGFYVMANRKLASNAETNGRAGRVPPKARTGAPAREAAHG